MRSALAPFVLAILLSSGCAAQNPAGDDDTSTVGPDASTSACPSACATGETCFPGHGCAECDPTHVQVCVGNDVYRCEGGVLGDMVESCGTDTCSGGSCGGAPACDEATQLIYVVDHDNHLLSFDPRQDAHTFHVIGTLACPAGAAYPAAGLGAATPYSMTVDRTGRAWILYTSGEIFLVDTSDASCQPSGYVKGSEGFELFTMSLVSDSAGSSDETLFVAGGAASIASPFANGDVELGAVDPTSFAAVRLAPIVAQSGQKNPDLSGTGAGDLWGYFPATGLFAHGAVAELDKATGARLHTYELPAESGLVDAWAFAHYGGRYYIFVTASANRVLRLDPMGNGGLGKVDVVVADSPYTIVGAGVSTCAPVVIE